MDSNPYSTNIAEGFSPIFASVQLPPLLSFHMFQSIHPRLPMRNIAAAKSFYVEKLGFTEVADYGSWWIPQFFSNWIMSP
jgi:hypothetical protein